MIERFLVTSVAALTLGISCKSPIAAEERKSAASVSPSSSTSVPAPRKLDERIAERILLSPMGERIEKDVFPKEKERVDFFNDDGQGRVEGSYWVQRVYVDLDRDGRWDEKWTRALVAGRVETTRVVSPGDDETYTETWLDRDDGRGWQRKP